MKKILTLMMIFFTSMIFSQGGEKPIEYPRFDIDSLGQKVITMTIPQAMKLNTDSNLLVEFKNLAAKMSDYETVSLRVINEKNEVIAKQDITIGKLEEQIKIKDGKIADLQGEILSWMEKNRVLEEQLKNRNEKMDLKDKQISSLKTKMLVTGIGGSAIAVGLLLVVLGVIH